VGRTGGEQRYKTIHKQCGVGGNATKSHFLFLRRCKYVVFFVATKPFFFGEHKKNKSCLSLSNDCPAFLFPLRIDRVMVAAVVVEAGGCGLEKSIMIVVVGWIRPCHVITSSSKGHSFTTSFHCFHDDDHHHYHHYHHYYPLLRVYTTTTTNPQSSS